MSCQAQRRLRVAERLRGRHDGLRLGVISRALGAAALVITCSGWSPEALASPVRYRFDAELTAGLLAGERFHGEFSFEPLGATGVGREYLRLQTLDFTVAGVTLGRADFSQGGEVIFEAGRLSHFTAAFFFQPPPGAILTNIAFGFGGPGVIGYSIAQSEDRYGMGRYVITPSPVPEPSMMAMSLVAAFTAASFRQRSSAQRITRKSL